MADLAAAEPSEAPKTELLSIFLTTFTPDLGREGQVRSNTTVYFQHITVWRTILTPESRLSKTLEPEDKYRCERAGKANTNGGTQCNFVALAVIPT